MFREILQYGLSIDSFQGQQEGAKKETVSKCDWIVEFKCTRLGDGVFDGVGGKDNGCFEKLHFIEVF